MSMLAQAAATTPPAYSLWGPALFVALATLVYLLIDVYLTTKTFRATLSTGEFYLLWVVFVALAMISYGAIKVASGERLLAFVGHPDLAEMFLILLAVGGALTVFQSFAIKIADIKVVDFGQVVDRYRVSVYNAVSESQLQHRKRRDQMLADRLATKYAATPEKLREEMNSLLQLAGIQSPEIVTRLDAIKAHAVASNTSEIRGFATAIVKLDHERARILIK